MRGRNRSRPEHRRGAKDVRELGGEDAWEKGGGKEERDGCKMRCCRGYEKEHVNEA